MVHGVTRWIFSRVSDCSQPEQTNKAKSVALFCCGGFVRFETEFNHRVPLRCSVAPQTNASWQETAASLVSRFGMQISFLCTVKTDVQNGPVLRAHEKEPLS